MTRPSAPTLTSLPCPRCGADVKWPGEWDPKEKADFAAACRAYRLHIALDVRTRLGMELGEVKSLIFHISGALGACHFCKSAVSGSEVVCAKCRSLNLNW
jgi:hypothetical protein